MALSDLRHIWFRGTVGTGNLLRLCRVSLVIKAALLASACDRSEQPAVQTERSAAPESRQPAPVMPRPPELKALPLTLEQGAALYGARCGNCHGLNAVSGGTIPDLRYMAMETHGMFNDIVLGGSRAGNGMPGFADVMSEFDANAVQAYIISRAREAYGTD